MEADPGKTRLPAEWAPQAGILLTWPHTGTDWAPILDQVEPVFTILAREIARREPVIIACRDPHHRTHVAAKLDAAGVPTACRHLYVSPSNDSWTRDHGPITVFRNGQPRLLDFTFNGWGGKYPADLDNQITARLHAAGAFGEVAYCRVPLVLEGGAIDSDGAGTLLTTAHCLQTPSRNPHLDATALTAELEYWLGVERVLWLHHGQLAGDDTDGHVDTLARFCDLDTIAYTACDDPEDSHYNNLRAMAEELANLRDPEGRPYRLVPLPWPRPQRDDSGRRLPATYANFLIINDAVLVPTYNDPADSEALTQLGQCFPERDIVAVPAQALLTQNGSLHCVTMQLPV